MAQTSGRAGRRGAPAGSFLSGQVDAQRLHIAAFPRVEISALPSTTPARVCSQQARLTLQTKAGTGRERRSPAAQRCGTVLCPLPPQHGRGTSLSEREMERRWRGERTRCGAALKQEEQKKVIQTHGFKNMAGFHSSLWIKQTGGELFCNLLPRPAESCFVIWCRFTSNGDFCFLT